MHLYGGADAAGWTLGNLAQEHQKPGQLAFLLGVSPDSEKFLREKKALDKTTEQLKVAGFPWPAPGPDAVQKMQKEGKWPPVPNQVAQKK